MFFEVPWWVVFLLCFLVVGWLATEVYWWVQPKQLKNRKERDSTNPATGKKDYSTRMEEIKNMQWERTEGGRYLLPKVNWLVAYIEKNKLADSGLNWLEYGEIPFIGRWLPKSFRSAIEMSADNRALYVDTTILASLIEGGAERQKREAPWQATAGVQILSISYGWFDVFKDWPFLGWLDYGWLETGTRAEGGKSLKILVRSPEAVQALLQGLRDGKINGEEEDVAEDSATDKDDTRPTRPVGKEATSSSPQRKGSSADTAAKSTVSSHKKTRRGKRGGRGRKKKPTPPKGGTPRRRSPDPNVRTPRR